MPARAPFDFGDGQREAIAEPSSTPRSRRVWYEYQDAIAWGSLGVALLLIAIAPLLPIQDYWNHVASAFVANRVLDGDPLLTQSYWLVWRPVPNIATELLLMGLERVFPVDAAGRAMLAVLLVAHALAFVALRRVTRARGGELHLAWVVPFALSSFFAFGFFNFQLGLALGILWLSAAEGVRSPQRRFVAMLALATLTYFCHALPFAIVSAFLLFRAVLRRNRAEAIRVAIAALPGAILMLAFLRVPETSPVEWSEKSVPPFQWWNLPGIKLSGLITSTSSLSYVVAIAKLVVLVALWRRIRREPVRDRALALGAIGCGILYLLVPFEIGHVTFGLDWRCLPFMLLFFVLSRRLEGNARASTAKAAATVALLTIGELTAYCAHWSARARELEPVVDAIPAGARVLPVVGLQALARVNPLVHLPAKALTRGAAYYPYLFAYRYHLIRQRSYEGRIPHPDLVSPWSQVPLNDNRCGDLSSPTGGWGWLGAPLVGADKLIECVPWKLRSLAGGQAGQFPDLRAVSGSFDGVLVLGGGESINARIAQLGRVTARTASAEYVELHAPGAAP